MLSPDKRESLLRAATVVGLAAAIWQAFHLGERPLVRAGGGPGTLRTALARWSTVEAPRAAHVTFDSVPTPDVRDWLAALRGTGTTISWQGTELRPAAVAVEPIADPKHAVRVWVAAPRGSRIAVHDSIGLIDSVTVRAGGAVLIPPQVEGVVTASVAGTTASAALRDSLDVKPLLVLGVAGWEAKFVIASLEEYGWTVDARLALAPQRDVLQGAAGARIDTGAYSAIVALDSSARRYAARIGDYVRSGGGFIASGDAAAVPAFATLLPGSAAPALSEGTFEMDTTRPRRALALRRLLRLKPDAVPIEMMDGRIAVAAHRVGDGRVLQSGYMDSWRWRMGGPGGPGDPVAGHRAWWSALVSSVAYAAPRAVQQRSSVDPVPMAGLVERLGAPAPKAPARAGLATDRLAALLFGLLLVTLLGETASRRLRGRA